MQKIIILAVLVVFVVSGSVLALQFKKQFFETPNANQATTTPVPETDPSPASDSAQPEKITLSPSQMVRPSNKPTLSPTKIKESNLQRFVYPGSTVVSQSNTHLTLESSDDTMQIVAWYKQALEREDAQINNTVVNTVNGKTTATLTVSANGQNMYVTITHTGSLTSIKLEQK